MNEQFEDCNKDEMKRIMTLVSGIKFKFRGIFFPRRPIQSTNISCNMVYIVYIEKDMKKSLKKHLLGFEHIENHQSTLFVETKMAAATLSRLEHVKTRSKRLA